MMLLQWRQPVVPLALQWRGPDGALEAQVRATPLPPASAIIGPVGPAAPAPLSGTAVLILPGGAGDVAGEAVIAAPGMTPVMRVFLSLAPADDADENDPDMIDLASVSARAASGSFRLSASFSNPVSGPVRFNWSAL
jgi:hypothetical protein